MTSVLKPQSDAQETNPAESDHRWDFYRFAQEAWDSAYADISQARRSVDFQHYIFKDNQQSNRFIELFCRKAAEGVRIRIHCDSWGSKEIVHSRFKKKMEAKGIEVKTYNTLKWSQLFRPRTWFPRNHSKLIIVDKKIAHIGGVCFDGRMVDWRDTQLRLIGPVVYQIQQFFDELWKDPKAESCSYADICEREGEFYYLSNGPFSPGNCIYDAINVAIDQAERYIYLTSPYFVPDKSLALKLFRAKERGVDVKIVGTEKTDNICTDYVSHFYHSYMAKNGIDVTLYNPAVNHTKSIVIDGKWATIGSLNLDQLSLHRNHEANLFTTNATMAEELRMHFIRDKENGWRLTPKSYVEKFPAWKRGLGRALRYFRWYL